MDAECKPNQIYFCHEHIDYWKEVLRSQYWVERIKGDKNKHLGECIIVNKKKKQMYYLSLINIS